MSSPHKRFGLFDTTMLVSGSMIGSGIFIVSAEMARTLGNPWWLLLCWVLTGLVTIFAALSYGELAGMMPNAGGQYVYLKKAFHPLVGFLYGWTVFLVIQTGVIAAVAVAFAKYVGVFFPVFDMKPENILLQLGNVKIYYAQLLAIGSIALLTWFNIQGLQHGRIIQRIFTSAKLMALFLLIIVGLFVGLKTNILSENFASGLHAEKIVQTESGFTREALSGWALMAAVGVAMIGSLFSSDAWNNVTFIAGEIKEPQKNIPMGLFLGTLIVTVLYVLANLAYLCLLPLKGSPDANSVLGQGMQFAANDRVGAAAMYVILGETAQYLMAALIIVSTFGCNNGLILAGSRLFQAMANDGLFFKSAKALNKNHVPANALIIQGIWSGFLCLTGSYNDLLEYSTFASLLFYMVTIYAVFVLRKKFPEASRPYRAFGYPVIPALYIIITLAICLDLLYFKTANTGMGILIVLLGIPVYYFTKSRSPHTL